MIAPDSHTFYIFFPFSKCVVEHISTHTQTEGEMFFCEFFMRLNINTMS